MNTAIGKISALTLQYAPQALGAIAAIESAAKELPAATKEQVVVNVVLAAAQQAEGLPIPEVSEVASLAALFVGILNSTGIFSHGSKNA
jgi:hypothetical protein